MAVSFDLFGTLVDADVPDDPASTIAAELEAVGVTVPPAFESAYREVHIDAPERTEIPLSVHVTAALASSGVDASEKTVKRAVLAAFARRVRRRERAAEAIETATAYGPVGLCSNCSVETLVERTLERVDLRDAFDAVVTSVDCGWRKPDPRAFEAIAAELGVDPESLVHVGDDPETDGGIERMGGQFVDVSETPLSTLETRLETEP